MDDQSLINNQWNISSYQDLSAMPMAASAAAFPDNQPDHHHPFLYDNYQQQLNNNCWNSCMIEPTPSPDPYNMTFPAASDYSADHASFVSSTIENPTAGFINISQPKQMNDYIINPQFALARLDCPLWNDENNIYAWGSSQGLEISRQMSATTRTSGAEEHVIAERKRREKLSQKFIALSAAVPGLNKTDKASVLAGAKKYIKQLEERVKILEDQTKSKTIESMVLIKKSQLVIDDNNKAFSSETFIQGTPQIGTLPEIEVRVCDKSLLIRVQCVRKKGVTETILGEVAKLHMTVVNSSVLAFGSSALDITVVAHMDAAECNMAVKDLVKTLHVVLKNFMY